ncbi:hypothetical protein EES43_29675 [Streptomyces sp. ADI96-02]|nr:hypothetical protein EES43_29675 [Streptomyces sp. ADI96-02]
MRDRRQGAIVNIAGMIAFSGPAPHEQLPRRAVYAGALAHLVAMSQTLSAELEGTGVKGSRSFARASSPPNFTSDRAWT